MSAAEKMENNASRSDSFPVAVNASKWVRDRLLMPLFGITPEMARKYRERGLWLEEKHWRMDPINRVVYNRIEIENWMEGKL